MAAPRHPGLALDGKPETAPSPTSSSVTIREKVGFSMTGLR